MQNFCLYCTCCLAIKGLQLFWSHLNTLSPLHTFRSFLCFSLSALDRQQLSLLSLLQSDIFVRFLVKWADSPRSWKVSSARSNTHIVALNHVLIIRAGDLSNISFSPHTAFLDFHILLIILKQKERHLKHPQLWKWFVQNLRGFCLILSEGTQVWWLSAVWIPKEDHRIPVGQLMSQAQSYQHPRSALNITERLIKF